MNRLSIALLLFTLAAWSPSHAANVKKGIDPSRFFYGAVVFFDDDSTGVDYQSGIFCDPLRQFEDHAPGADGSVCYWPPGDSVRIFEVTATLNVDITSAADWDCTVQPRIDSVNQSFPLIVFNDDTIECAESSLALGGDSDELDFPEEWCTQRSSTGLTLEPGAEVVWRFAGSGADCIKIPAHAQAFLGEISGAH